MRHKDGLLLASTGLMGNEPTTSCISKIVTSDNALTMIFKRYFCKYSRVLQQNSLGTICTGKSDHILNLTNKILECMLDIFVNFSKAFDAIKLTILIN